MTSDSDENDERPRGILSTSDRDFLLHPDDYSRQASHGRRRAIVERTTNAIRDFWFLADRLDDQTLDRIADELAVDDEFHRIVPTPDELLPEHGGENPGKLYAAPNGLHRGVVDSIALLYRLYGDDEETFEQVVARGVQSGIQHARGGSWRVDVEIDPHRVERFDLDDVIDRLESGDHDSLSDFERQVVISHLATKDAIDFDALR